MKFTKNEYNSRVTAYLNAYQAVAKRLGEDHPMVCLMGSLARGRYDAEGGPDSNTLRDAAVRYGFLWGIERLLVSWCNENKEYSTLRLLLDSILEARRQWHLTAPDRTDPSDLRIPVRDTASRSREPR